MRIAIAGGTGTAGRVLHRRAVDRGHDVRVLTRSASADPARRTVDLASGAGLDAALEGVDALVDVSNKVSPFRRVAAPFFVQATEHLLAAEHRQGVDHHVVVSIVGVDRFDLGSYRAKLDQEQAVEREGHRQGVPFTVARVAQFHDFAALTYDSYRLGPVALVPPMHLQPVHLDDVADHLLDIVESGPVERAPDLIGPGPEELPEMVRRYAVTRPRRARVVPLPLPPAARRANEALVLRPADAKRGTLTFDDWLRALTTP